MKHMLLALVLLMSVSSIAQPQNNINVFETRSLYSYLSSDDKFHLPENLSYGDMFLFVNPNDYTIRWGVGDDFEKAYYNLIDSGKYSLDQAKKTMEIDLVRNNHVSCEINENDSWGELFMPTMQWGYNTLNTVWFKFIGTWGDAITRKRKEEYKMLKVTMNMYHNLEKQAENDLKHPEAARRRRQKEAERVANTIHRCAWCGRSYKGLGFQYSTTCSSAWVSDLGIGRYCSESCALNACHEHNK